MAKLIHIFKAGKHQPLSGGPIEFSEEMLQAAVDAYDPAVFDAPLVVGHPSIDAPAYGWVGGLHIADGQLYAEPVDVDPQFAELVEKKRYKKISPSWYMPDSPNNPKPGKLYLKHVGFLGAVAPAVKGLKSASFADGEEGVVEFADWDKITVSNAFRRLREWIIGKDGLEVADQVMPTYELDQLIIRAVEEPPQPLPAFSETPTETPTEGDTSMTPEEKARLEKLEADNAALLAKNAELTTQAASFAEAETKRKKDQAHADNVSFAEGLIKEGKLKPADQKQTVALLDSLAAQGGTVEFGEGEGKQSKSQLEIYKAQLSAGPKVVDFSEQTHAGDEAGVASFAAPDGMAVDAGRLELHNKAVAYAEKHSVSYTDALAKVK